MSLARFVEDKLRETEDGSTSKGHARTIRTLKGTEEDGRIVMHIDMDCFFVSAVSVGSENIHHLIRIQITLVHVRLLLADRN
jgi:pentose-5-phosphate-3-epimerase